jgi:hypothetical protein
MAAKKTRERHADVEFTEADIRQLLKEARAPPQDRWANAGLCSDAAVTLTQIGAVWNKYKHEPYDPAMELRREFWDKARDLSQVLKPLLRQEENRMPGLLWLYEIETWMIQQRANIARLQALARTLDEVLGAEKRVRKGRRIELRWDIYARALAYHYRQIVGPSGIARRGPLCRFIGDALARAGCDVTYDAVERELRRSTGRGRSTKP